MYTRIDVVKNAEERAEAVVFKDRMRYAKFIEAGERFAAKNGLIVGGPTATLLLLGDPAGSSTPPLGLDSFQYKFFSGRAVAQARALGDTMYQLDPQGLGHYTTVLTKVPGHLLAVSVDGRDLFTVAALPFLRGVRTVDIIVPSERPAQFAKEEDGTPLRLPCTGPEIQLMEIYAELCNPAKASSWGRLLTTEAALRALFGQEIRTTISSAMARVGGASHAQSTRLHHIFRNKYATGSGRVLVGPAAIALLTGQNIPGTERLQVITAGRLEGDAQEIVALAKSAGAEVAWKVDDPKNPTEPRLRRMAVHHVIGGHRELVLEVYNSAAFDLVPYVALTCENRRGAAGKDRRNEGDRGAPAALKIGTPFVLMRYRLIDMWAMQVLMHIGAIDVGFARTVLHRMLAGFDAAAAYYEKLLATRDPSGTAHAHQLLPTTTYIGRLEEPELALKRAALSQPGARFCPPYLPALRARSAGKDSEATRPRVCPDGVPSLADL